LRSHDIYTFVTTDSLLIPYTDRTMATDDPLVIERRQGKTPGILIFQLTGPVTLSNLFEFQDQLRSGDLPRTSIIDFAGVPYMDSAGMGAILNYYVHCQKNGVKLIVAGISGRVMELFKLTHVDTIMSFAASAEEAEASV
jgi:anti-sigma B factor antagonist